MPEEDALDIERLSINCRISLNFQNKILCKRPVCYQIETEEYEVIIRVTHMRCGCPCASS